MRSPVIDGKNVQVCTFTADGTYATDLYKTDPDKDTNYFSAAMVYYDQD